MDNADQHDFDDDVLVLEMLNFKVVPKEPGDEGYHSKSFLPTEDRIYEAEYYKLQNIIDELTQRNKKLERHVTEVEGNLMRQIAEKQEQLVDKERELDHAMKTAKEYKKQVECLASQNSELSNQLSAKQSAFEVINNELVDVKAELVERKNKLDETLNQVKNFEAECSLLQEQVKRQDKIISSKSKEYEDALTIISKCKQENENHLSTISGLQEELKEEQNKNSELETKREKLERENHDMSTYTDDLEKRYANLQNELKVKTGETQDLRVDLEKSNEKIRDLENSNSDKQLEITALKKRCKEEEERMKFEMEIEIEISESLNSSFELISGITEELEKTLDIRQVIGINKRKDFSELMNLLDSLEILPEYLKSSLLSWQEKENLIPDKLPRVRKVLETLLQLLALNLKRPTIPTTTTKDHVQVSVCPASPQSHIPVLSYRSVLQSSVSSSPLESRISIMSSAPSVPFPNLMASAFSQGLLVCPHVSYSPQFQEDFSPSSSSFPEHFPLLEVTNTEDEIVTVSEVIRRNSDLPHPIDTFAPVYEANMRSRKCPPISGEDNSPIHESFTDGNDLEGIASGNPEAGTSHETTEQQAAHQQRKKLEIPVDCGDLSQAIESRDQRQGSYICPFCERKHSRQSALMNHLRDCKASFKQAQASKVPRREITHSLSCLPKKSAAAILEDPSDQIDSYTTSMTKIQPECKSKAAKSCHKLSRPDFATIIQAIPKHSEELVSCGSKSSNPTRSQESSLSSKCPKTAEILKVVKKKRKNLTPDKSQPQNAKKRHVDSITSEAAPPNIQMDNSSESSSSLTVVESRSSVSQPSAVLLPNTSKDTPESLRSPISFSPASSSGGQTSTPTPVPSEITNNCTEKNEQLSRQPLSNADDPLTDKNSVGGCEPLPIPSEPEKMQNTQNTSKPEFPCKRCGERFPGRRLLQDHWFRKHENVIITKQLDDNLTKEVTSSPQGKEKQKSDGERVIKVIVTAITPVAAADTFDCQ